jgi:hypothetical protein
MANGDIPVEGSAVVISGSGPSFKITAKNFVHDEGNFLLIRTTPGKRLHIFVKADVRDPASKEFDADVSNNNWKLEISERP